MTSLPTPTPTHLENRMTTVLTRPAARLYAPDDHIRHLFAAVLAHAAGADDVVTGQAVPAGLMQVHIEVRGGHLRMACTDRYTLGLIDQQIATSTDDFTTEFAVDADTIRKALATTDDCDLALIVEENTVVLDIRHRQRLIGTASTQPWRIALERTLTPQPTPTGQIALNPAFLARLEAAAPLAPDSPMTLRLHGPRGTVVATLGDAFLGLIMPIRHEGDGDLAPWFDLVDEDAS